MNNSIAITPHFSDKSTQTDLFHNDRSLSVLKALEIKDIWDTSNPFDLRYPLNKFLRYQLFLPSLSDTLAIINFAHESKHKYHIDLTSRGRIHPTFIRHYAKTLLQCVNMPKNSSLPIRWKNLIANTRTREIDIQKLTWS